MAVHNQKQHRKEFQRKYKNNPSRVGTAQNHKPITNKSKKQKVQLWVIEDLQTQGKKQQS